MAFLTLFTLPKGFVDPHVSVIQHNALASWRALGVDVEVLVMGDDPGVADAAREHGAIHVGDPEVNDYGTPRLDWAFREAAARGSGELLCYANADIVLLADFLAASRALPRRPCLAIGQRWDCDITERIDFDRDGAGLAAWVHAHGRLDARMGSDHFVFPRETSFGMPAFAVGRPGWDNWIMGRALALRMPLIDITPVTTVVHQNHDYGHVVAGGGKDWEGPEAKRNRDLAGSLDRYMHTPANATHVLTPQGLRRASTPRHLRAKAEAFTALDPRAAPLRRLVLAARRLAPARAAGG